MFKTTLLGVVATTSTLGVRMFKVAAPWVPFSERTTIRAVSSNMISCALQAMTADFVDSSFLDIRVHLESHWKMQLAEIQIEPLCLFDFDDWA